MPDRVCRLRESDLEAALHERFRAGVEQGRLQAREETSRICKAMVILNGDGHKFAAALAELTGSVEKAFDEGKVKRDHGKFSTTGAGKDGDNAAVRGSSTGADIAASVSTGDKLGTDHMADAKAASLAERIAEVPAAVVTKVREWVQGRYTKLAARYGDAGAKAILGAMVLLAPTPIPGSSLLPVAIAEAVLRIRRAIEKGLPASDGGLALAG